MKLKKMEALLLALLLAMSLLTACGKTDNTKSDGDGKVTVNENGEWMPSGSVTLLVGWDAGGGLDTLARALAPALGEYLGVDVVVNNMPGANGAVAVEYLLKKPADGQMVFLYSSSHAAYPATGVSDATYEQLQMLQICQGAYPTLSVPASSDIKDMNDLIAAIQAGGTVAANAGIGSIWHVPQIVIVNGVGGSCNYAPYDSGKSTALAIAQGEVDWGVSDLKECAEFAKDGMIRPLAVCGGEAVELDGYGTIPAVTDYLPELADVLEVAVNYRGIGIKRGADQAVLDTWYKALAYAMESQDFLDVCESTNTPILNIGGEAADEMSILATKTISWMVYDAGAGARSPEEVGVPRP